jgi:hypothetical protein
MKKKKMGVVGKRVHSLNFMFKVCEKKKSKSKLINYFIFIFYFCYDFNLVVKRVHSLNIYDFNSKEIIFKKTTFGTYEKSQIYIYIFI